VKVKERTAELEADIAERKQVEEALRDSEERFRLVAEATRDAVYDWDIIADKSKRNKKYVELFAPPLPIFPTTAGAQISIPMTVTVLRPVFSRLSRVRMITGATNTVIVELMLSTVMSWIADLLSVIRLVARFV